MRIEPRLIDEIAANLASVRTRIDDAARRVGRAPADVTLVAVSKQQAFDAIAAAYAVGQRDFGENRLEELLPKADEARRRGLTDIRWHMIGTIQSRKSAQAVGPWTLIHSVDRLKLAQRLSRDAVSAGVVMPVLLEVNVSGEASKHGFTPQGVTEAVEELVALPGIQVRGLMTMAPYFDEPEATRPVFRGLCKLRDSLVAHPSTHAWRELSMGMTNDFEIAVEEGATLVRIGSAIFGARPDAQ